MTFQGGVGKIVLKIEGLVRPCPCNVIILRYPTISLFGRQIHPVLLRKYNNKHLLVGNQIRFQERELCGSYPNFPTCGGVGREGKKLKKNQNTNGFKIVSIRLKISSKSFDASNNFYLLC